MSDHAPPDLAIAESARFLELSRLVHRLGEELASYRKRALSAEARLRAVEEQNARATEITPARLLELRERNADLERRVEVARARTQKLLARVRFLQQQRTGGGPA